jgi:hypothetical protein
MEIKFQIFKRVFSICIGHKVNWFEQTYFLTIEELWHSKNKEVEYATMIFHTN